MSDDGFGHWLAGLIDGEGCFLILHAQGGYRCRFVLALRADDASIMQHIASRLNYGNLTRRPRRGKDNAQVRWEVSGKQDCRQLADLLTDHPLRTKKARDLLIWREALTAWLNEADDRWARMAALRDELTTIRRYSPHASSLARRAPAPTRTVACVGCGTEFRVARRPGRYPTRCAACALGDDLLPVPAARHEVDEARHEVRAEFDPTGSGDDAQ